ncbi:MAG: PAS domain S-box protein [Rhodospirillales bacterium]|jgi:PAS domain S-box-containing protein|nr:PAS domain S-box protein [Rhodospirillales bacterium]
MTKSSRFLSSGKSLVGLSVVLLLGFGGLFYVDGEVKLNAERLRIMTINAERILNADRSMTAAVRLAASLESDHFLLNYQNTQDTKYALLEENARLQKNEHVRQAMGKLVDIQDEIEGTESEAISLIDQEKWEEALELVTEPSFQRQKGIYRASLSGVLREMIQISQEQAEKSDRLAEIMQYVVLCMFGLLAAIGALYSRETRRSLGRQTELAKSLEAVNENLEQTVSERTAELRTLASAVDQNPSGIVITDVEGCIEYVNPRFSEITGYAAEEAVGKTTQILKSGEMAPEVFEEMWKTILSGNLWSGLFKNKRKNGEIFWTSSSISPVADEDGQLTHFVGVIEDITEKLDVEHRVAESEERTRLILSSAGEGIFGLSPDGEVTFCNHVAAEMLGYREEELLGVKMHATVHHTRADGSPYPPEECPMRGTYSKGVPCEIQDEVLWRSDGSSFPVEYSSLPMRKDGELVGSVVVFRDITERKRGETVLVDKMEELEKFSRIAVGRELRMIELKEEINGLLQQLGRDAEYEIADKDMTTFNR